MKIIVIDIQKKKTRKSIKNSRKRVKFTEKVKNLKKEGVKLKKV